MGRPPPSFGQCPKENVFFSLRPSLKESGFPTTEEGAGSSDLGSDQSNTGMLDLLKDYAKVSSRTDVPHIASPEVRG